MADWTVLILLQVPIIHYSNPIVHSQNFQYLCILSLLYDWTVSNISVYEEGKLGCSCQCWPDNCQCVCVCVRVGGVLKGKSCLSSCFHSFDSKYNGIVCKSKGKVFDTWWLLSLPLLMLTFVLRVNPGQPLGVMQCSWRPSFPVWDSRKSHMCSHSEEKKHTCTKCLMESEYITLY